MPHLWCGVTLKQPKKELDNILIKCIGKCGQYYHLNCAQHSQDDAYKHKFTCKTCNPDKQFSVKRIDAHRVQENGSYEYLVEWRGYTFRTWETEDYLKENSIFIVNEYRAAQGLEELPVSEEQRRVGATGEHVNRDNWLDSNQIEAGLDYLLKLANLKRRLPVAEFDKANIDQDKIYYLRHASHCYILYHIGQWFVADGADDLFKHRDSKPQVKKRRCKILETVTGLKLQPIFFIGQTKVDHCGSSFILAAVEIMRSWPTPLPVIVAPKWLRDRLTRRLHPHKSKTGKETRISNLKLANKNFECAACDKSFKTNMAVCNHQRRCTVYKQSFGLS